MVMDYSQQAQDVLRIAKVVAKRLKSKYIGTEHVLIGLIKVTSGVAGQVLIKENIKEKDVLSAIKDLISLPYDEKVKLEYSPRLLKILEDSKAEAKKMSSEKIGTEHVLLAIVKDEDSTARRILQTIEIKLSNSIVEDILGDMDSQESLRQEEGHGNGSEDILATFTKDLIKMAKDKLLEPVIGREEEIDRLKEILLRKNKNNPCLVGEPGIGKTAIVEGLAIKIASGFVPESLKNKRILSLDLPAMLAGTKYRGEFEERIKNLIKEIEQDPNVILFMDEVHTMVGAGGSEGSVDASNMLKPALSRGKVRLIGATTTAEYRKYIEKDAALERRFQPVKVEEPNVEQCVEILQGIKERYEIHHNVVIEDDVITFIVESSKRYIYDRFLPDKAIDVLDEACVKVGILGEVAPTDVKKLEEEIQKFDIRLIEAITSQDIELAKNIQADKVKVKKKISNAKKKYERKNKGTRGIVDKDVIAKVISTWSQVPITKLEESEIDKLLRLEKTLQQRVTGQLDAIKTVSKAIKRGRVGLKSPNRPIGSFLFLGPTGVGKTELTKALTEVLFDTEESLIRFDMSEYMEKQSASKLIGSPPGYVGYGEGGLLTEKVRSNPYAVILFDEVEKAHPDIYNVLLQILDDGHVTDSKGRKVDFKNTIIIMTSNAGAQSIVEPKELGFIKEISAEDKHERMRKKVMEELKQYFRPEFLNRIDDVVVFHMLEEEHMKEIVNLLCKEFCKRVENAMGIKLSIRDSAKKLILTKGTDKKYGARPLRRAIQQELEDSLADAILTGDVKRNENIVVGVTKDKIKFYKK